MALFWPSLPPLFGSIKEDSYEMTCLFLLYGADPNSLILYEHFSSFINQNGTNNSSLNIDQNFDSKKPRKSRNHGKKFVRPLDVALAMRKGRTVSALIACGADINVIDMENLKTNIKNQLEEYREDSSTTDIYNLPDKIRHLRKDIDTYYLETQAQLDIIRTIENFRTIETSPLINNLRKHYSRSAKVLASIKEIAEILSRKRNELIKSQLELLADDEKIMNLIKRKNNNIRTKIKKQEENKNNHQETDQSDFSMSSFSATESDSMNDSQTNNRAELLYYNNRYSDLKELMNIFIHDLNEFHENSLFVMNQLLHITNDYLKTIYDMSDDILQRLGFSNDAINKIEGGNQKKAQIIQTTSSQLNEQKNIFIQLYMKIRNCILYYLF